MEEEIVVCRDFRLYFVSKMERTRVWIHFFMSCKA